MKTSFTVWSLGNDRQARVIIMTVLKNRGLVEGFLAKMILTTVYRKEPELLTSVARKRNKTMQATSRSRYVHSATSK